MKKTLLITFGTLLIVLIVGTWVYLIMYGKPVGNSDVFTQLNTDGGQASDVGTLDVADTLPQDIALDTPARLRKITGRAVAGAHLGDTSIRYVEKGTGHIYETNIETGAETLVSGTTIPQTTEAAFSFDGANVAITALARSGRETIVGTMGEEGVEGVALPVGAREVAFTANGQGVYYLLATASGSAGHQYDLAKKTSAELFSIPLRDVRVLWGSPHYVYTTPTSVQTGYLYRIAGKSTLANTIDGLPGLVAMRYGDNIAITSIARDALTYTSLADSRDFPIPVIPEKCVAENFNTAYLLCAAPAETPGAFPDDWYMGAISYVDVLWELNTATGEADVLLNLATESGETIDVYGIGTDRLGIRVYLINKNDNSLWVFDRSVQ